ncbi:AAA family ATPase [Prosthecobacter vanneervenii]|uniref:Transposase-like protein n=1 Tax=Prosthecobacter vanneervenii TaxID=48466 RepID=A0A7W7YBU9_9BACT|nr:AAA family ATPase [Prosthecobacter vanneervenii]MBB5033338.1 transposase-like protein [Prosthecobacter vanneervenii]
MKTNEDQETAPQIDIENIQAARPFTPTAADLALYERMRGYSTLPAGTATHTLGTGSPAPAAATPPPPRPPLAPYVLTALQLKHMKIPKRPALLDRWLCEGDLGYIFAPRGVGKTWMAMSLPRAISQRTPLGLWAAGSNPSSSSSEGLRSSQSEGGSESTADTTTSTLDLDPPPSGADACVPVLYIDGEMSMELTQYRSNGLQMEYSGVQYLHHEHLFEKGASTVNIGEAEDRQRITNLILESGYRVLILDNLSSLASGVDENKGMDYEPISHWLLDLRRRKITVIVVHHAGRNGAMRGHSKREDACAWIIELRDARQDDEKGAKFVSHFTKPSRNTGDPLPDLLWHYTSDEQGNTHIKCELAVNSDYEQFIQHVMDGVTSQKDIAELMDKNKGTISKWARRALDERRISGGVHKLLPPKTVGNMSVKSHYDPDEDDSDEDAE